MDCFWVRDAVISCLIIQQVKEVFHSERNGPTCAQNHGEQIINKLLQRALQTAGDGISYAQCSSYCLPTLSQTHRAPRSWSISVGESVPYLHGEQSCEVDLRYGLGPLSFSQTASSVFGQFRFLTGLYKMPQSDSTLICIL